MSSDSQVVISHGDDGADADEDIGTDLKDCDVIYRLMEPIIQELEEFYKGMWLNIIDPAGLGVLTLVQAVLLCVCCDMPATRFGIFLLCLLVCIILFRSQT